jgi:membrane protein implicated in regulation of membrane protease activity
MSEEPNGRGPIVWWLAAHVVCCGAALLAATGALSLGGIVSWLLDGGYAWLGIAVLALAMFCLWQRQRAQGPHSEQRSRADAPRGAS